MFPNAYRTKYDAIVPRAEFRLRLNRQIAEARAPRRHGKRKIPAAVVVALIALLILATGAMAASGALTTIFQQFLTRRSLNYARLDQSAAENVLVETLAFANGGKAVVRLEQSYYNGEQLALGWSLRSDPQELHFLERDMLPAGCAATPASGFPSWVCDEARAEFDRLYSENGWACVSYLQCYMDSELYAFDESQPVPAPEDADDFNLLGWTARSSTSWDEDGADYFIETLTREPLPDALRNRETLSLTHYVYGVCYYYYRDETGLYHMTGPKQCIPVTATVRKTDTYESRELHFSAEFPHHTAEITLTLSPIQAKIVIENAVDPRWMDVYNTCGANGFTPPLNLEEDIIWDYRILADGKPLAGTFTSFGVTGKETAFMLPAGVDSIIIRPVYANTGEHPDEDVVLSLTE